MLDALTTCNACDAAPMVEGDPAGYCAGCLLEAAQSTMEDARALRDRRAAAVAAVLDDERASAADLDCAQRACLQAEDMLDAAKNLVRSASRLA